MAGLDAYGVQLERSDMAATAVFTAIANITSLSGPELERDTYDTTAHDSPNGWREFIGGLKNGGEVSLDINYDPPVHDTLVTDFDDNVARDYRIVFPGNIATWAIQAFQTGFSQESPIDDKLSASITLKVTGQPVLT